MNYHNLKKEKKNLDYQIYQDLYRYRNIKKDNTKEKLKKIILENIDKLVKVNIELEKFNSQIENIKNGIV